MPDTSHYQDVAASFDDFVRAKDPFVAIVLFGHLAIEELLNRILKSYFPTDVEIADARLTFYQKTILAKGLTSKNVKAATWKMVLKINRLRNEIGHNLSPGKSSALVDEIRAMLHKIDPVAFSKISNPSDEQELVIGSINFSIGFLGAYLRERLA